MYITEELVRKALENAQNLLKGMFPQFNCPVIKNIKITNAMSYWALIGVEKGAFNTYNIRVSRNFNFIKDERRAQLRLEESMIHEMIHTMPACWNHGTMFQFYANKVNKKYPEYKIQTSTSDQEVGIERAIAERKPKYITTCKKCGNVSNWYRKPKYDINLYCCGICGGNLTFEHV